MPTEPLPELASDFVPFATAALDFHRAINMPVAPVAASRTELDSLHAHLVALYGLLDAHTARTAPVAGVEGDHLRACRVRLWQAAEHLHAAYHAAPPRVTGRLPTREACRARLPEGAPDLTMCQRHLATAARVRRDHTPADLRDPFTGLIRH
ncbi:MULTISPECIES: DUF6238 family protein [unclassified Streptomyces]|uniref:DUF6238 family protein n=1 Tax=unclassified Streptomyces TaxID=2593676 RepID=UPI000DAE7F96|nr:MULTISPECIES: DUF6238 family protein [unclassified Streptomyces]PZT74115.1 hypothetical protein DNK55_18310 [Streptomyces sp. AC1-42T]PZT82895.1 hypothetical protein DNK56_13130 [Streptomyces sp. AC1-42W]